VFAAIAHREPDRVPLYVWVFRQPGIRQEVEARYGSYEAFHDALSLDLCQSFPARGLVQKRPRAVAEAGGDRLNTYGAVLSLEEALETSFTDPDDPAVYTQIQDEVAHHKGRCGRAIFLQTPGVFEAANGIIGMEATLLEMATRPALLGRLFEKIARWSCRYVDNALDIGIDVVHVSDDWGQDGAMLFSPRMWWEQVYPAERLICDQARRRSAVLSLHSDGYITPVLPGIVQLGFQVFHPVQASAGMDQEAVKRDFGHALTLYGGLDVRTVLGRGDPARTVAEVRRVMRALKPGGGLLFCTSHMVQPGTSLDEVDAAFRVALEESWYS
jgi:uroporphyrinogen decarboxylase